MSDSHLIRTMRRRATARAVRRRSSSRSSSFPLLMIVVGIIQFGIGLNYWLDMQRIANQGARWAAVNCARSAQTPSFIQPVQPIARADTCRSRR